jgi:hypothetical protein
MPQAKVPRDRLSQLAISADLKADIDQLTCVTSRILVPLTPVRTALPAR